MITHDSDHSRIHLVLFFTRDVGLRSWADWGMLEREIAIYRRLQQHDVEVSFVTYGDERDLLYSDRISGIRVLCNRWRFPAKVYALLLPFLHGSAFRRSSLMKTNQINGGDVALRAARYWRKPLIARCGMMWSISVANQHGSDSSIARQALRVEAQVFGAARKIVVTAQHMAADIESRIQSAAVKTIVIPNYVDVDAFAPPQTNCSRDVDVIFVGRLKPQKNIGALIEAVTPLNISTGIIAGGSVAEEADFRRQISGFGGRIRWIASSIPNPELPKHLNRAKVYILPSHWEGHPKTLIEAMACGLPVIGADSPGIREVIRHGETGLLCAPSPEGIRGAIQMLLKDAGLRARLGNNARRFAVEHYSLDRIVGMELSLIQGAAAEQV